MRNVTKFFRNLYLRFSQTFWAFSLNLNFTSILKLVDLKQIRKLSNQVNSIFRFFVFGHLNIKEKISCHFQAIWGFFIQKINKEDSWFFLILVLLTKKQSTKKGMIRTRSTRSIKSHRLTQAPKISQIVQLDLLKTLILRQKSTF